MPDDDMGKGNAGVDQAGTAITDKTFEAAALGDGSSAEDAMLNTYKLLQQELQKKGKI